LTQPHLSRRIGDDTLETWINKSSERGKLSPFARDVVLWEVQDEHIPKIRRELRRARAIFDWTRDIPDIEGHPQIAPTRAMWDAE
jgi:hypothetical protein